MIKDNIKNTNTNTYIKLIIKVKMNNVYLLYFLFYLFILKCLKYMTHIFIYLNLLIINNNNHIIEQQCEKFDKD